MFSAFTLVSIEVGAAIYFVHINFRICKEQFPLVFIPVHAMLECNVHSFINLKIMICYEHVKETNKMKIWYFILPGLGRAML